MSEFRSRRVVVTGACGVFGRRIAAATYPDDIREELDRWRNE